MSTPDRHAYSDPSVLDAELTHLFSRRMYAGSVFDVSQVNDYRSFLMGPRAITVRNTGNGIRAFNNVCLHRNALIDPVGSGNRAFRCNYHGWSYDGDGSLKNAPLAEDVTICERKLAGVPVSLVQGLCFLGWDGRPEVSGIEAALSETNIVPAAPFHREALDHACNWKLLVENVLEGYHLSYVHQSTFLPAGFSSTASYEVANLGDVSWGKLTPTPKNDKSKAMQRLSPDAGHFYHHVYIFPDLFLSSTNGLIGFQSHLRPVHASRTLLEWSLFELPALARLPASIREQVKADAVQFTNAALREDQVLVESCQLGLSAIGPNIQLQPSESRIQHFHDLYRERMPHVVR
ncbi:SRPBCC family protein [Leptospira sp. 96542]|nr:SRPBCC family protein [Leptospira sp. 96542]